MNPAADGVLSLAEVAAATGGTLSGGDPSRRVRAVVTDSRAVAPGALFAALRGPRQDGHAFVEAAARGGAVAALVDRPVDAALALIRVSDVLASLLPLAASWRARFAATAIGVTGSAGKTTTVRLLAGMLDRDGDVHASRPSWNAEIGVPMTVFGLRPEHQFVVVEMGMRGSGHIATLCAAVRPRIGVVTNVGASHLEALGSLTAVARAKAELIEALPAGGTAVINADDPLVAAMRPPAGVSILRFGFAPDAEVRADALTMDADGSRFTLVTPLGSTPVCLALPGCHLVANALAAAAAATAAGAPLTAIAAGITTFSPPPMRLEVRTLAADIVLVDDSYNASPASLRAALDAMAALRGRRRVIVALGEMLELGALREAAHEEAGRLVAGSGVAHLIVVGDAGRHVAAAAIRGGLPATAVEHAADALAAGTALRAAVRGGDLVLVKASRGVGLERAVAALLERYPPAGAGQRAHEEGKPA